ncbi:MAG: PD-(D/E)XK nuclease family protein [Terracidiphilus sp.]
MGAKQEAGPTLEQEITAWLREGGLVVTASERAARALTAAFHRACRAEGLKAWPAPAILDYQTFLRTTWRDHAGTDGRLLLDPLQEQSIWEQSTQAITTASGQHMATLLEGPRNRMASLAMQAHQLLCTYAPQFLRQNARAAWQQDAENFSDWLSEFDKTSRAANLLSFARLPLELIPLLEAAPSTTNRPPLLLVGFDRILPMQRRLLEAWGRWQEASRAAPASEVRYYQTADTQAELTACALWCKQQLAANPQANLLVITQNLSDRRGEIERAFLNFAGDRNSTLATSSLFEFSLGIPLSQIILARGAHLALRWLSGPIAEDELDWLFSTSQIAADHDESIALQTYMRILRRRGLGRPQWSLDAFLGAPPKASLPRGWVNRLTEAQTGLAALANRPLNPLEWAELIPQLLQTAGWPGARTLSSAEHQSRDRWQQAVESCAALGFDGRRIRWPEFLSILARALDETLFAPESREAPIQIAGPAESAGLTADAIWFLGASETAWPAAGATHPLLPLEVQRNAAMPHATAQLDWELARAITLRLLCSAPQVCFSYARQSEGVESRSSRLITQLVCSSQPIPAELVGSAAPEPLTVPFEDFSRIPFPPGKVEGGSSVLTHQSQCPFKAFAIARLDAQSWQPAEPGLTAAQRGSLLHAVLHSIWAGPPHGIRSLRELQSLSDRTAFVATHVARAAQQKLPASLRDRMPRRYLELEEQRLLRLISEWLNYESTRIEFEVAGTEVDRTIALAGLTFDLRLDRIDRLNDDSLLVIDYKSGAVTPNSWQLPRPDDVQLPLYAGFALGEDEELGGLVFAKVRSGDQCFTGHVGDAKASLFPGLPSISSLVKNSLTVEQLIDWRDHIEQLAADFLNGRAEVDPRDYPKTCEHCGLQTLCRVAENRALLDPDELSLIDDAEAAPETAND